MKLYLLQETNKKVTTYDITQIVSKYTWAGSVDQACRSVEFSVLNAPYDKNTADFPRIKMGDFIKLYDDDNNLIYYGMVYTAESTSAIGEVAYTSYDLLYHFTKSTWSKSFKGKTPEAIAKVCCSEVGVTAGNIVSTKINIPKLLIENGTIYDTMLKAFKKASVTSGKKYLITMNGKKLDVIVKGTNSKVLLLADDGNITSSSIKESIADIINRVKIYNSDNKYTGVVSDNDSIKKYGIFQSTYTEEEKVDAKTAAKGNFKKPTQEITMEAVGYIGCKSGYSVYVKDGATGLTGEYWVIEDSHTFENGAHTMTLTLSYQNTMGASD